MYDYLIVGAGLFGATFARQIMDAGKSCMVIDRRDHIAGNCYTENWEGIDVHIYGPHLFHTSNERVWKYVNRFADFNGYHHTVMAQTRRGLLSLPINLSTLNALYGISTPYAAEHYFSTQRLSTEGDTIEDWCLRTIGQELYELLIRDYTIKQWGVSPSELPASIIRRLPIRKNFNNRYFSDRWEGVPIGGYTAMVQHMLQGATIELKVDFLKDREAWCKVARKVVFTGSCDELYDYDLGKLPYRSIRLEHQWIPLEDAQGMGQINYTAMDVPWTRIIEPKHFTGVKHHRTVVFKEFSDAKGEPAYPINSEENMALAQQYRDRAEEEGYIVGGRLGRYQYYDMHQVIAQALRMADEELK